MVEGEDFRYDGGYIEEEEEEVRQRIGAAGRMLCAIRRPFLDQTEASKKTKMTLYRLVFLPLLMYSSEPWTLASKHRSQIQSLGILPSPPILRSNQP